MEDEYYLLPMTLLLSIIPNTAFSFRRCWQAYAAMFWEEVITPDRFQY